MENNYLSKSIDNFLGNKNIVNKNQNEVEETDSITGESYVVTRKDGLIERINKKYLTEDGRQLLQD